MSKEIVIATGNRHKIMEISEILTPLGYDVRSADDVGGMPDVVEDADTFEGNAVKKAVEAAKALGRMVLADDSGLEVFALNGEPGVYSARYAGEGGNNGRNLTKLLAKMEGISDRSARFVCVIAVATPGGLVGTAEGEVRGKLALAPAGQGGFAYDPAFIPDGYDQTFGELPQEVKNSLSHRSNALKAAIDKGLL
ncbi:MAG: RdgB/HAM1 family non-canonical purine NTP pyrophosphatase [Victivallales bacterium]|nr:RdgB/HAM1 family non-canonical purine NTP pyrophosphatase [Victivallales bacterium]